MTRKASSKLKSVQTKEDDIRLGHNTWCIKMIGAVLKLIISTILVNIIKFKTAPIILIHPVQICVAYNFVNEETESFRI